MDEDLAAIEEELEALRDAPTPQPSRPRLWLPAELPRVDIHHEPALCLSQERADPPANAAQSRLTGYRPTNLKRQGCVRRALTIRWLCYFSFFP